MIVVIPLFVVLGLVVGSFANVLIWRLDDEKAPKFWQGRSICPKCKKTIAWFDNIPLLSYIFLGGKCRHCKKKISLQYPLVELTTAITTALVGLGYLGNWGELGAMLIICWSFIVIFFADWVYGLIPDEMEITAVLAGLVYKILQMGFSGQILQDVLVGLISAGAFFVVVVATKFRGMGLGDVKLAFVMGFLLGGRAVLAAFWWAFILGGVFAVTLMLLKRKGLRDTMALGPFLVLGTIISALWCESFYRLLGI